MRSCLNANRKHIKANRNTEQQQKHGKCNNNDSIYMRSFSVDAYFQYTNRVSTDTLTVSLCTGTIPAILQMYVDAAPQVNTITQSHMWHVCIITAQRCASCRHEQLRKRCLFCADAVCMLLSALRYHNIPRLFDCAICRSARAAERSRSVPPPVHCKANNT
jgi:hypothetical protein